MSTWGTVKKPSIILSSQVSLPAFSWFIICLKIPNPRRYRLGNGETKNPMKPLLRPPSPPVFFLFPYFHLQIRWSMKICLPCHVHLLVGFCFVFVFHLDAGWSSLELCHNRLTTYHLVRLLFPYKRKSPPGNRAVVIWPTQKKKKKKKKKRKIQFSGFPNFGSNLFGSHPPTTRTHGPQRFSHT